MITNTDIVKTVRSFRDGCLGRYKEDIDLLSPTDRQNRLGKIDKGNFLDQAFSGLRDDPVDNIAELLTTPRLLKTVLRRVYSSWDRLHGEIDFDDMLVANVLRFGAPEGYDFLLQRFTEIRGLRHEGIVRDADKRRKSLNEAWEQIAKKASWDASAAYELVVFLFPDLKHQGYSRKDVPQGVRHAKPTDYWIRFNREHVEQSAIPDQEVLNAIARWKRGDAADAFRGEHLALALFRNPALSDRIEQFGPVVLDGNEVRALASALFALMLSKLGAKANEDSCAAFLGLWRVSLDRDIPRDQHFVWILPEILKALTVSLHFATRLYYFWRHNDHNSVTFKQPCPELRAPVIEKARELFSDSPSRLIEVLDPDFMYSVFHLASLLSGADEGGNGFHAPDWRWLADSLVRAAQQSPRRALPQAIPFLVSTSWAGVEGHIHKFNEELAVGFFGDSLKVIMQLLAEGFDTTGFDAAEQSRITFIKEFAAKWLKG